MIFALQPGARAADDQYLHVTLDPDQTIRQVAEKYLSDPDLWPDILSASGIQSIADVRPGTELLIPVTVVSAANKALVESLGQIQKANQAGAQIFAPDEIGRAVDLHEQALQKRLERAWQQTKELAVASFAAATTAIEKAEARRDQAAEALVSDRTGLVEGQRPEDLSWRDLALRAILIEEEKVRTLSDSTAQITFRDASRLRLNSNSNAIIKVMRFDPLHRTEEAKVSLVEGDFYALLAGDNARTRFNVEIPQANATIDFGSFWVGNKNDTAKFANYDEKPVNVAANGATVTLGKNEGTVVGKGEKPMAKRAVLPPPTLLTPADNGPVYITTPELTWAPVEKSAGYWLEVSSDQGFDHIVANQFGLDQPKLVMAALPVGEYFWRVSALDGFGLPGERSEASRFTVAPDDTPPYLKIDAPGTDVIVREAKVEVSGETEPNAVLTLAGKPLATDAAGHFATTIEAASGRQHGVAGGDRSRRQQDDARAQVRLHARRAVGGRLRPGHPAERAGPFPDQRQRHLAERQDHGERIDRGAGRQGRAGVGGDRSRRAFPHQRAAHRRRGEARLRGDRSLGFQLGRGIRRHHRSRGAGSGARRDPAPADVDGQAPRRRPHRARRQADAERP